MVDQRKKFIILGGGISGLSLAWYLKKRFGDGCTLTLIEKSERVGGWIKSYNKEGCVFERGPRSFRSGKPVVTMLKLIQAMELQDQIIPCDRDASVKYIYMNKHLWALPSNIYGFFLSPVMRRAVNALWKEQIGGAGPGSVETFFRKTFGDAFTDFMLTGRLVRRIMELIQREQLQRPSEAKDETIASFFLRRLGSEVTFTFVDAWVTGIFAGDINKLSIKSCFPQIYKAEKEYGSLMNAFGGAPAAPEPEEADKQEKDPFILRMRHRGVFSFRQGLEQLPLALEKKLGVEILKNCEVTGLGFDPHGVDVFLKDNKPLRGDHLFSAIPSKALAPLTKPWCGEAAQLLNQIPNASLAVVTVVYKKKVLKEKGLGYLIPRGEEEKILGCFWNSSVFPQQFPSETTSLSVMIGDVHLKEFHYLTEDDFKKIALEALSRHLDIHDSPDIIECQLCLEAIPQYILGHSKRLARINALIREFMPHLTILGASYYGVGISDCISQSKRIAKRFDEPV